MSDVSSSSGFNVNIMVHAAGPVRPRTKYKDHKLLRAEGRSRCRLFHILASFSRFQSRKNADTI